MRHSSCYRASTYPFTWQNLKKITRGAEFVLEMDRLVSCQIPRIRLLENFLSRERCVYVDCFVCW
ncbi:hypothetical protein NC652_039913 [Populus alba x Populus x berolinensis]|nr:hypothetical protein NC652_039913 [Populus alba x Populus x berolinensis]